MANKKLKFDLTNSSTNNPVDSQKIYHSALIKGGSKEMFEQIVDAKDRARIRKHNFGNVLQSDSCSFSDQGAGTLTERLVDVCPIKVNVEICQSTLEQSFIANAMRSGSNNADFLPADFQNYLSDKLAEKMSADFEKVVWQGNTVATGTTYPVSLCDGLIVQFSGDSDVVDVTATTITSSNVIAELNKVYNAIPETVKFSPNMKIFVPSATLAAYKQAVAAASSEAYYTKDVEPTFLGIQLVLAQGMPSNKMVAAETTNLFLVTDLVSDFDEVKILPMLDRTGDDTVRIVGRVKFAVSYAYGAEVVLYN